MSSLYLIKRLFDSNTHTIVEIKLLSELISKGEGERFEWLYLEKKSGAMIKLWLRSRDSSPAVEERFFEQGYLKFNRTQGTFIEKFNSAQFSLDRNKVDQVSEELLEAITAYLS